MRKRLAAWVCGLAIVAAACAARNSTITGTGGGASTGVQARGSASARPSTSASGRVFYGGSSASHGTATRAAPGRIPATASIDDNAALGRNTYLYLNRKVPKLLVEVLAVSGYDPAPLAMDTLRSRLQSAADKPGGIVFLPIATITGGHDTWTVEQLQAAEAQSSRHTSSASAMVLHILYVNGQFDDGSSGGGSALGAAFSASTFAIFKDRIASASTPLVPPDAIEAADVVHETGHVLALVNLTYHSPRNHEDQKHRGHSSNPNSVMYYAIDNVGVVNLLGGRVRPPTDFDADDRADLQDLRTGKLP